MPWTLHRVACAGALLVSGLGCGSSAVDSDPQGCLSNAECAEGEVCQAAACVQQAPPAVGQAVDDLACSVLRCPSGAASCCSGAVASATGNGFQAYAVRLEVVDEASATDGEVRVDFSFDAPNQQGWVTFELGEELELSRLVFTGRYDGVADRYLSVNTKQQGSAGCAFAFDLQRRPAPPGSSAPFVLVGDVPLVSNDFCYGGGQPGRASELAFSIFSFAPGDAALIISSITLLAE